MDGCEQGLLDAARAGDRAALERLLQRHRDQVYRYGVQLCGNAEDAEDVQQDTLWAMARSVQDFEGRASLSSWLYAVARSYCLKKRRRSKHAPRREEALDTVAEAEVPRSGVEAQSATPRSPEEEAVAREIEQALADAIGSLDAEQREVLLLRDVEGWSSTEAAEALGISVAATKSRLHRARHQLRSLLQPPS